VAEQKLNLGCGSSLMDGWINVDRHEPGAEHYDVMALPYTDVDEILAKHILEHFAWEDAFHALTHWRSILKPGGKITIVVPDIVEACKLVVEHEADFALSGGWWGRVMHMIYGTYHKPGMSHKYGWTIRTLPGAMMFTGFDDIVAEKLKDDWCPVIVATAIAPLRGKQKEEDSGNI